MDHTDSSSTNEEFSEEDTNSRRENVDSCNEESVEKQSKSGSNNDDYGTEGQPVLLADDVEESESDEETDFNLVVSPGGKTKLWQPIVKE
ncbi:hypothetical protein L1887_12481 [Cichorium endivia]|nr:hypothetical protein L1887_12481 [Cichorium endivia]